MKATSLLAFVSLCLLTANAGAVEFPYTDVPSGIGVAIHVMGDWGDCDQRLDLLQAAGVTVARVDFFSEYVPINQDGTYDFHANKYSELVAKLESRDIRVYGNLMSQNYSSYPASYYGSQDFRNAYTAFATAAATEFANKNVTWQLWNEPNRGFWPGSSVDQYMAMVNQVVPSMRDALQGANDTTTTIVAPAIAAVNDPNHPECPSTVDFLTGCFQQGLLSLVDGVDIHPYRWGTIPETVLDQTNSGYGGTYYNYADLRTLMNDTTRWANGINVKIIDGEWGYTSCYGDVSTQTQADYAARMMLTNASYHDTTQNGIPCSMLYDFANDTTDPKDPESNYGMVNFDLTPKPSFYAIKTLTTMTKGATVNFDPAHTNVTSGSNANNHVEFNMGDGRVTYATWNTGSDPVMETSFFGNLLLTNTPLYVGLPMTYTGTNGLWNGTGTNWTLFGNQWQWSNSATGAGLQAIFDSAKTITVDGDYQISGIQLNGGNVTLNNNLGTGTLRFTSGGGALHGDYNLTIGCPIADPVDPLGYYNNPASCVLRKSGTGTLTLSGANTIHAGLLIGNGSVLLNNNSAATNMTVDVRVANGLSFGSGMTSNTLTLGGLAGTANVNLVRPVNGVSTAFSTLIVGGNNCDTGYTGILSGNGTSLVKNGSGYWWFGGASANTYTGTTTINGGTLMMANAGSLGNPSAGNETIIIGGAGCLDLMNKTVSRPINLTGAGSGLSNSDIFTSATASGVISGTGSLTKYGGGVLILSGSNNNYTGATTIKEGTLKLGDAHVLGNPSTGNETISLDDGCLDMWGWNTPGYTVAWPSTDLSRNISITSAGGGLSNTDADYASIYAGAISGDGTLTKYGAGELVLAHANTYTGATAINAGMLTLGNAQALGTSNTAITLTGGCLNMNSYNLSRPLVVTAATSTLANKAAHTTSVYNVTSATVNTDFEVNTVGDIQLTGAGLFCETVNGWPHLIKTGTGTLTLSGSTNNTNLTLEANAGTVILNKDDSPDAYAACAVSIGSTATVQYRGYSDQIQPDNGCWINMYGGTLDFNGLSQTSTALTVYTAGSTLANTAAGTTSTFSPTSATLDANLTVNAVGGLSVPTAMTGSGKLTKDGTGTLTLSKANTYSGGTTVKAGTLLADFTASGAPTTNILPNTGVLTLSGGTLITKFSSASSGQTVASTTVSSGGSDVTANNAAKTLSLSAITRNTAGGTVNFSTANSANIRTSTANCNPTGSKQSILGGYATFGGNTWAVSGNTGGPWNISGLTSYSTTFTANQDVDAPVNTSTISNNMTINSLRFNKSTAASTVSISSSKTLTVATGGILETSTVGTRAVTISGANLTTGNGKDLIVHQNNPNASMTISANISGSGLGLTKSGVGNLILSGTKNYNGVTTVNGGTLTLNSTGNINAVNGVVMLNTGGTLLQNNTTTALTRSITFNGGTLGGSGQYAGNINMDSSSGHLSPGAAGVGSTGTLTIGGTGNVTLGSTSVLDFDLNNTTAGNYDVLALTGTSRNLTLDGTINITSSTGTAAGYYPIITGITGTFVDNILNFGTVPSGHSSWTYYKDGTTLYVHAAPEPGTVVLLATGLLGLLAYAWRKRR